MSALKNKAIVTGASSGIGSCLATELAAQGCDLLLIARTESKLKKLAEKLQEQYNVQVNVLVFDLSQVEKLKEVRQWCETENFIPTILVNNAGLGLWGLFEQQDEAAALSMCRVNMEALTRLTFQFLPLLKQSSWSYILNVGSTAAYQAIPTFALYAASKSYVLSFSRALHEELKAQKVSVTCLTPGVTESQFIQTAGLQHIEKKASKFAMSAESVAKAGVKGMFKKRKEVVPGFMNWASTKIIPLLPRTLVERMAQKIYL